MARIIIIENEPVVAEITAFLLTDDGHDVTTASTIDEAEALFTDIEPERFPHVVFSDANLEAGRVDAEHGNAIIRTVGNAAMLLGVRVDFVSISNERVAEIYDLPTLRNEYPNLRIHSAEKSPHAIAELASQLAA